MSFLRDRTRTELVEIACEAMERACALAEFADERQETADELHNVAIVMGDLAKAEIGREKARVLQERRQNGAKGGNAAAAITREVRDKAIELAMSQTPAHGWKSAPEAAAVIADDLAAFAKAKGRNPARRKVEEWLRIAGIKRRKHAQ